jgi:hypothetical protein
MEKPFRVPIAPDGRGADYDEQFRIAIRADRPAVTPSRPSLARNRPIRPSRQAASSARRSKPRRLTRAQGLRQSGGQSRAGARTPFCWGHRQPVGGTLRLRDRPMPHRGWRGRTTDSRRHGTAHRPAAMEPLSTVVGDHRNVTGQRSVKSFSDWGSAPSAGFPAYHYVRRTCTCARGY